jgi:hypothetical protein
MNLFSFHVSENSGPPFGPPHRIYAPPAGKPVENGVDSALPNAMAFDCTGLALK